jgi:hypothetical protein
MTTSNLKSRVIAFLKRNSIDYQLSQSCDFVASGLSFDVLPASLVTPAERKKCERQLVTLITDQNIFPRANGTESNGHLYLHKCAAPFIGVDVALFESPPFPYADDRPPCFYRVRFDNNPSPLEVWDDEKIRWEMIVNRIQYAGGFIDSRAILAAYSITRKFKQASWFSRTRVKTLVGKYLHKPKIYDTFAGWGERMRGVLELGLEYEGWDLNQEVVDWVDDPAHYKHGDARLITIDDPNGAYFSCPPYKDTESYFEGQEMLETDEWMDIVFKNVRVAEYLFVCKKPGKYLKNAVETITNRSHFGKNDEHVLYFPKSPL